MQQRPRCPVCRNPIKEHQAARGAAPGERTFHEDCWHQARSAAGLEEQQRRYEEQVAAGGLSALLAPYVSDLPEPADPVPADPGPGPAVSA